VSLRVETVEPDVLRLHMHSWQGRLAGYDVSAYVVRGVLIDSGAPRTREELLAAVHQLAPRGAIITHCHEDHAGNAAELAASGLPLLMDSSCELALRHPAPIGAYRRLVWGSANALTAPLRTFDPAPLVVLPFPGHTKEHLVVWDAERRILAGGDLFLGVKVRVAHDGESPRLLVASLRAAVALEPRLLLDAHRGVVHDPVPLLRAKIAWMEETIGEIETLGARGLDDREITRRVLGREELVGWISRGEYSRRAFVRAVLQRGHERTAH
jgi:glyoxylase-like metal-dependent hydrolase (beta-lactamase superfamily II)